jgi:glycosyltransferase involved in cell wall biosynthesis
MSSNVLGKLKVLQIIDTFGMGGVETWLMELLRYWRRHAVEAPHIDILSVSGNAGIFDDEARSLGARIFYLRYSRSDLSSFTRGFRKILRQGGYAAMHDHQWYTSGWHFLMGAGLLPPVRVTHVHNPSFELSNLPLARRVIAGIGKCLVAHYSTHITGTSRQLITEFGFDEQRFDHIPKAACYCGFEPLRFLGEPQPQKASVCREFGWPEDAKIILLAGRIDPSPDYGHWKNHKNSGFAVSVGIECARRDRRVHVLLAGAPSPAVQILEERIAVAGFARRIVFAGIRLDIERLMLASDVLLFPSRGEGLGMVAVEAQAAGLPVLASSAVPRECVVVPNLMHFKDLDAGEAAWAADLLSLAEKPRNVLHNNQQVTESAFAIDNSARALVKLYREGPLT